MGDVLLRLRLDLAYDGTDFSGWAAQPGLRTVAGSLSDALKVLLRTDVPLVVAGRTDAGVHASGQVAHIDVDEAALIALTPRHRVAPADADGSALVTEEERLLLARLAGIRGLLRRLAGILPLDVRVRDIVVAPAGFDARFAAMRRHYRYRLTSTPYGAEPLRRFDTVAWPHRLDTGLMAEAAQKLVGLHDFAAYCKPREGATTIRELQSLTVLALDEPGEVTALDVVADAFCHSMVRALVGSLIAVGEGRFTVDRPAELLAARVRSGAINVAPARGLTLVGVDYPPAAELGARAEETRSFRSLD